MYIRIQLLTSLNEHFCILIKIAPTLINLNV